MGLRKCFICNSLKYLSPPLTGGGFFSLRSRCMYVAVNEMYESAAQDCMGPDTRDAIASTATTCGDTIHIFKPWGEDAAEAFVKSLKHNSIPFETDVGNY